MAGGREGGRGGGVSVDFRSPAQICWGKKGEEKGGREGGRERGKESTYLGTGGNPLEGGDGEGLPGAVVEGPFGLARPVMIEHVWWGGRGGGMQGGREGSAHKKCVEHDLMPSRWKGGREGGREGEQDGIPA